jgi:hypothetical protein
MLSPFAIKLSELEHPHIGAGRTSGKVFFWSTCGSLVGTVLTAFFLIPTFGLKAIIFGTTLCVLLIGGVGQASLGERAGRTRTLVLLALVVVALCAIFFATGRPAPGVLFSKDGMYQRLTISDGTYAGRPARFFFRTEAKPIFGT